VRLESLREFFFKAKHITRTLRSYMLNGGITMRRHNPRRLAAAVALVACAARAASLEDGSSSSRLLASAASSCAWPIDLSPERDGAYACAATSRLLLRRPWCAEKRLRRFGARCALAYLVGIKLSLDLIADRRFGVIKKVL